MFGIEGKLWKSRAEDSWLIAFPSLDSMTEGKTKEEAIAMGEDLICSYLECYFEDQIDDNLEVKIIEGPKGQVAVIASEYRLLISLFLIKQREQALMNLQQTADQLGAKSRNAYKQYEKGKIDPSVGTLSNLIQAVNPTEILCINTLCSITSY